MMKTRICSIEAISQHPTTSNIVLVEDVWSRTNRVLVLASSRRQSHQKYIAGVCEIDAKINSVLVNRSHSLSSYWSTNLRRTLKNRVTLGFVAAVAANPSL